VGGNFESRTPAMLVFLVISLASGRVDAQSTAIVNVSRVDELPSTSTVPALAEPQRLGLRSQLSLGAPAVLTDEQAVSAQPLKGRDSVLNGVLIGAGVGALLGLIPDYYDDCEECHDSLYASIAVGAGIGLLVDLLRSDTRTSPTPQRGFDMSVAAGPRALGVHGVVRWR
jgi:hypothetical protein